MDAEAQVDRAAAEIAAAIGEPARATLPVLELQESLQRFTTQFADRITQAMQALERASLCTTSIRIFRHF